jgi:hypothetical protein
MKGQTGTPSSIESTPKAKKRRALALRRQEKRWAQKAGEVKVIRPEDLPEDSTLR